jgi:hypothetical protein
MRVYFFGKSFLATRLWRGRGEIIVSRELWFLFKSYVLRDGFPSQNVDLCIQVPVAVYGLDGVESIGGVEYRCTQSLNAVYCELVPVVAYNCGYGLRTIFGDGVLNLGVVIAVTVCPDLCFGYGV